ncbi:MAG: tagaturonate reductase [Defluviitaleaceae bacterium]|nr:tagaturonate reductase [Defluviitaleaceae bacterium]
MKRVNEAAKKCKRPVTVLQYGEGNFLRGFVDYMIDIANEQNVYIGSVQIIKNIPQGDLAPLKSQDCVYTVLLRGKRNNEIHVEKRVVTSVAGATDAYEDYDEYAAFAKNTDLQVIVSNTTEAGIVYDDTDLYELTPPNTYPGKLTKLLHERYEHFNGDSTKGLIILPCELNENNGDLLLDCCLKIAEHWKLPPDFLDWMKHCNMFCNTLVDRIMTGYPTDEAETLEKEFGYKDDLIVTGEPFALWVIESKSPSRISRRFPLDKIGFYVIYTNDLTPYRERKVRLLNGTHTASVLAAYMAGLDTVGDMMKDTDMRAFVEKVMYTELAPMVPLPEDEVNTFARSVIERFENPFIRHNLLSIALNSFAKFKVRVLPTILETYEKTGSLPKLLTFSLAAFIRFYSVGERDGIPYTVMDDDSVKAFFNESKDKPVDVFVPLFLSRADLWGRDLTTISGLTETIISHLYRINDAGMRGAVHGLL